MYKYDPKKYVVKKFGIPIAKVESISVSPNADTFVVIHVEKPLRDLVLGTLRSACAVGGLCITQTVRRRWHRWRRKSFGSGLMPVPNCRISDWKSFTCQRC